ncbi:YeeE/YedE family protein [Vicingus serpentipes]|uniref:YeeE/YedE family protein n=1 Tax=Vicingus serpentipes TaxID=1926625 RepID=UPI001677D666|nr:YeeE/YedE thiosulfate transporter family protein [Vicingus serpentipes]
MEEIINILKQPWPWYISGPLLGLIVPMLLIIDNKKFGVSSIFKHFCTLSRVSKNEYFTYSVRSYFWNFLFVLGVIISGFILFQVILVEQGELSDTGILYFGSKNIEVNGILPKAIFNWSNLFSLTGLVIALGGFLIGFGSRYAGGCTSGHAITGLSLLSLSSLIAVIGFFIGGIIGTFLILDNIL